MHTFVYLSHCFFDYSSLAGAMSTLCTWIALSSPWQHNPLASLSCVAFNTREQGVLVIFIPGEEHRFRQMQPIAAGMHWFSSLAISLWYPGVCEGPSN